MGDSDGELAAVQGKFSLIASRWSPSEAAITPRQAGPGGGGSLAEMVRGEGGLKIIIQRGAPLYLGAQNARTSRTPHPSQPC